MTPAAVLELSRDAGLTVRADGDALVLKPVDRLTPELRAVLLKHKLVLLAHLRQAANDPGEGVQELDTPPDPARCCWPAVPELDAPMNSGEIEAFTARVLLFMRRGLPAGQADALAVRLNHRDREADTRRCCLECQRLTRARMCSAWNWAGAGVPQPGTDLLGVLQRCPAFAPVNIP